MSDFSSNGHKVYRLQRVNDLVIKQEQEVFERQNLEKEKAEQISENVRSCLPAAAMLDFGLTHWIRLRI